MAKSKATRRFEKNHLQSTLKIRNDAAKIKQKQLMRDKKKKSRAEDHTEAKSAPISKSTGSKSAGLNDHTFAQMATDKFFESPVDVPQPEKKKGKKTKKETKVQSESEESDSDDELEDVDVGNSDDDSESDLDVDKHQEQLAKLKEQDPEFFKFLNENDKDLLEFEGGDDVELSADEDGENKEDESDSDGDDTTSRAEKTSTTLTKPMVEKWHAEIESKHSLRAAREVVVAFRAAVNLNLAAGNNTAKQFRYTINNPDVYNDLLQVALRDIPAVVDHYLPLTEGKNGKIRFQNDSKHFRTLSPLLKSHLGALQKLLESLSDDSSLRLALESVTALVPYSLSFKKVVRDIIRTIVEVWSGAGQSDLVRISAFITLERLVRIGDGGIRETVLKTIYQGVVKMGRNTTVYTLQSINLVKNSAVQVWGIDSTVGYTTGFAFIRQLAIHLRTAITNNSADGFRSVYNWQFVHSLDFWSRVLATYCHSGAEAQAGAQSPLRPLIYPVVQLTLGAIRLVPTAQYFPLRFQLIRSLLRLGTATSTFIPLAPALYEVLTSSEMRKRAKQSTAKPLEFDVLIRAPATVLGTRVYQDGLGEQVCELLSEAFVGWTTNVAFPELSLPVVVLVKRWVKESSSKATGNRNGKINTAISLLIQKIEATAKQVESARATVDFAPNNRAAVERFAKEFEWQKTALGAYVIAQRIVRQERQKMVEASRKEDKRKRDPTDDPDVGSAKSNKKSKEDKGVATKKPVEAGSESEAEDSYEESEDE